MSTEHFPGSPVWATLHHFMGGRQTGDVFAMIKKVLNITRVKQDLLRLVASGDGDMVITKDYEPVGTLIPRVPRMDHAARC